MEYRILIDENTSPRVAASLRDAGVTAEHFYVVLSEGVDDDTIATFAYENDAIALAHNFDSLSQGTHSGVSVLYYAGDTMDSSEIVDRVVELIEWVPDPEDILLPTNLNKWE
jgi:hypothetical protein